MTVPTETVERTIAGGWLPTTTLELNEQLLATYPVFTSGSGGFTSVGKMLVTDRRIIRLYVRMRPFGGSLIDIVQYDQMRTCELQPSAWWGNSVKISASRLRWREFIATNSMFAAFAMEAASFFPIGKLFGSNNTSFQLFEEIERARERFKETRRIEEVTPA